MQLPAVVVLCHSYSSEPYLRHKPRSRRMRRAIDAHRSSVVHRSPYRTQSSHSREIASCHGFFYASRPRTLAPLRNFPPRNKNTLTYAADASEIGVMRLDHALLSTIERATLHGRALDLYRRLRSSNITCWNAARHVESKQDLAP